MTKSDLDAKQRRYLSQQEGQGNLWISISESESEHSTGRIEVMGWTDVGYRLYRFGSVGPIDQKGLRNVKIGSANIFFGLRKNAENYALMAALAINGDVRKKSLLDPWRFGGVISTKTAQSERLRRTFWKGAIDEDITQGWDEVDPDGALRNLPIDNALLIDKYSEGFWVNGSIDERSVSIDAAVDELTAFYEANLQLDRLSQSPLVIARKALDYDPDDDYPGDMSYACLLALSGFRDRVPARWIFPDPMDSVPRIIDDLKSRLSEEARQAIDEHRARTNSPPQVAKA